MRNLPLFDGPEDDEQKPNPPPPPLVVSIEHGRARRDDPETSKDAAKSVLSQRLERMVAKALLGHSNGLIADELEDVTGLTQNSLTPRTKPMEEKSLIYRSQIDGKLEKRPGRSGRMQTVWKLTDKGRVMARLWEKEDEDTVS